MVGFLVMVRKLFPCMDIWVGSTRIPCETLRHWVVGKGVGLASNQTRWSTRLVIPWGSVIDTRPTTKRGSFGTLCQLIKNYPHHYQLGSLKCANCLYFVGLGVCSKLLLLLLLFIVVSLMVWNELLIVFIVHFWKYYKILGLVWTTTLFIWSTLIPSHLTHVRSVQFYFWFLFIFLSFLINWAFMVSSIFNIKNATDHS